MHYAIVIIRYRKPLDEVLLHIDAHRAYLRDLQSKGIVLASGPFVPRFGGGVLLRVPGSEPTVALDKIRDEDPFIKSGVAQYEILSWDPGMGREALDALP